MEINSIGIVRISTEEYNELRDFKSTIERNDTIKLWYSAFDGAQTTIITKDKSVKDLINSLKDREATISGLELEIKNLKNPQPKETTLQDIKKMNIFEFIKWKRKNK